LSRLRAERAVIAETRSLEMLDVAKRDAIERYPLAAKLSVEIPRGRRWCVRPRASSKVLQR
jgi:hypothetical protein